MSEMKYLNLSELVAELRSLSNKMLDIGIQMECCAGMGSADIPCMLRFHGRQLQGAAFLVKGWAEGFDSEQTKAEA